MSIDEYIYRHAAMFIDGHRCSTMSIGGHRSVKNDNDPIYWIYISYRDNKIRPLKYIFKVLYLINQVICCELKEKVGQSELQAKCLRQGKKSLELVSYRCCFISNLILVKHPPMELGWGPGVSRLFFWGGSILSLGHHSCP